MKITCGHFLDLADLLSANLRMGDNEPQTFLEGKLVMSAPKRRVVEVSDILTWTEAFSIYQMVCAIIIPAGGRTYRAVNC